MTKPPIPTENSKTKGQHTNATKIFDYTTIADRLRTVSWSNKSSNWCGLTGLRVPNLPTNRKNCLPEVLCKTLGPDLTSIVVVQSLLKRLLMLQKYTTHEIFRITLHSRWLLIS